MIEVNLEVRHCGIRFNILLKIKEDLRFVVRISWTDNNVLV